MQNDTNGRSTCPRGKEQYEWYTSKNTGKRYVQYDYRTADGQLFSCITATLEDAIALRDEWLEEGGYEL